MDTNHLPVVNSSKCDACHTSTTSWQAVKFDHSLVSSTCLTCHDGAHSNSKGLLTSKPKLRRLPQVVHDLENSFQSRHDWHRYLQELPRRHDGNGHCARSNRHSYPGKSGR
jgi:hypothetical protein